ncbi:LptA/OstA family protein [Spirulina sp. CS-785/01]|uniref:LptA/OstA family protein n=1 Tax=Spirulina sp. CS-785/01 TaxID=3021716 RepID=UPI00232F4940|nr:LptA/OstA family protein [Spirulina sp. CS-785/01]MDB9315160.1 LptA/OstA family protein [Spirulina sp. CS-785/01]
MLLSLVGLVVFSLLPTAYAQSGDRRAVILQSDIQEANQITGVITARGNVRVDYPARQMHATAAQAQYFSEEGRIVLTGNVHIVQAGGNSLRGETVTYLVNEGRVIATPQANRQVESVYMISDPEAPTETEQAEPEEPFNPKPAFKEPYSDPLRPQDPPLSNEVRRTRNRPLTNEFPQNPPFPDEFPDAPPIPEDFPEPPPFPDELPERPPFSDELNDL